MKQVRFTRHPGLTAVFTGVPDGDMARAGRADAAAAAEAGLAAALGLDASTFTRMSQVHSADVAVVARDEPTPEVDALVDTEGAGQALVLTADCVPVVFAARVGEANMTAVAGMTAVAHAGRKGLLAGVLTNTVDSLRAHGAQDIEAWIGPSICGDCYEVPQDMADAAEEQRPGIASHTSWGTPSLDLPGAARTELEALGVLTHLSGECTLTDPDFFSYRGGDTRERNASFAARAAAQGG